MIASFQVPVSSFFSFFFYLRWKEEGCPEQVKKSKSGINEVNLTAVLGKGLSATWDLVSMASKSLKA